MVLGDVINDVVDLIYICDVAGAELANITGLNIKIEYMIIIG
jgi:hypothetical protein